jgi:hypothetical protein
VIDDDPLREPAFQLEPLQHTHHAQRRQRSINLDGQYLRV